MAVKVEHWIIPKRFRLPVEKGTKVVSVTIELGRDGFSDYTAHDLHTFAEQAARPAAIEQFIAVYGAINWDFVDCSVIHTAVSVTYELRQVP